MHFYQICLIFLHITSTLCYLPHLIIHITHHSFHSSTLQSKLGYIIYWVNYSLIISGVLIWCLFVLCQKQINWQIIQISGLLLIGKLIYSILDVTTRILLKHKFIVIIFDFIHISILFPAIVITFLLVKHIRITTNITNRCQSFIDQC